jgi:hypothetical protein
VPNVNIHELSSVNEFGNLADLELELQGGNVEIPIDFLGNFSVNWDSDIFKRYRFGLTSV